MGKNTRYVVFLAALISLIWLTFNVRIEQRTIYEHFRKSGGERTILNVLNYIGEKVYDATTFVIRGTRRVVWALFSALGNAYDNVKRAIRAGWRAWQDPDGYRLSDYFEQPYHPKQARPPPSRREGRPRAKPWRAPTYSDEPPPPAKRYGAPYGDDQHPRHDYGDEGYGKDRHNRERYGKDRHNRERYGEHRHNRKRYTRDRYNRERYGEDRYDRNRHWQEDYGNDERYGKGRYDRERLWQEDYGHDERYGKDRYDRDRYWLEDYGNDGRYRSPKKGDRRRKDRNYWDYYPSDGYDYDCGGSSCSKRPYTNERRPYSSLPPPPHQPAASLASAQTVSAAVPPRR